MTSIRDFVPLSKLGQGTFSTVYKVRRLSDQKIYALKKVRMNNLGQKQKENALNEVRILASVQSEYIVGYKQAFFDDKLSLLCIVMEYADQGDLQKLINQYKSQQKLIPEYKIWNASKQILSGLSTLHSKGILHRDLKSANIFLHNGKFKLGDLNVSKVNGGNLAYTQTGTPYYASPQVWRDQPYDQKSDIWSFGCIILQMAALRPPFVGRTMDQLFRSIQTKSYASIPQSYSDQLKQLIDMCLQKNPKKRKSASEILTYPLFVEHFRTALEEKFVSESISSQNKKQLLQTIKLPSDLRALKNNLPASKYQIEAPKKRVSQQFVSFSSQRPAYKNKEFGQYKNISEVLNKLHHQPGKIAKNNDSYASPRANIKQKQYSSDRNVLKTPQQNLKLENKIPVDHRGYSQRVYRSDNKTQNNRTPNQYPINSIIDQYIKNNEKQRRPITSMPRTEKRAIINNSIACLQPRECLQEIKSKLVKKGRIFSNNSLRPSWWG